MDLQDLNKPQREAAECIDGPLLILAGAGSGKTRVLTYRIAHMVQDCGVAPWQILALTFTNKAAGEMRARTEQLVGCDASEMWVMTFHSCCARLLRRHADKLGYDRSFVIYDDADQMTVYGEIIKSLSLDDKVFSKRMLKETISGVKNRTIDPEAYLKDASMSGDVMLNVYRTYMKKLKQSNAMDFDDLLRNVLLLFEENKDVLEYYQNKFRYILVDEYQDTNMLQYRFVQMLSAIHRNICVVGDDDQSIYGWRGADIRNILEFEHDFPGATVVRLEQNYRSTQVILDAANAVIGNNRGRKQKKLWTTQTGGALIENYCAQNERYEADYVCSQILHGIRDGRRYDDFAILYRTNAQSRVLETALIGYGIPYRVYGGTRFYERKEIKDILAYLRLLSNPADDVALLRVINVPRRGIGENTVSELALSAAQRGVPMFLAAMEPEGISNRARPKIEKFVEDMKQLLAVRDTMPLHEFGQMVLDVIRYDDYLRDDKKESYETRAQNVAELIGAMREFEDGYEEDGDVLMAYLENVALISDIDSMEDDNGQVALMTLHSAKGLEFPAVFITGMEDEIFPGRRILDGPDKLEEERRLCYVGITRARARLYLVHARQRALFGKDYYMAVPSRFLDEIPDELMHVSRYDDNWSHGFSAAETPRSKYGSGYTAALPAEQKTPARQADMHAVFGVHAENAPRSQAETNKTFAVHARVRHATFGEGTVLRVEGAGTAQIVEIDFGNTVKKFAAAYAPIETI